jgi:hypothetical protein
VVYGNRTKANFPKKMLLLERIYIRYTIIIAGFRCCARTNNSKAFFQVEHTHTTSVYYLFLHFFELSFLEQPAACWPYAGNVYFVRVNETNSLN